MIFVCDFDPFHAGKYQYTFRTACKESADIRLSDGRQIIFLNARGENSRDVSEKLVKFFSYVKADLRESQKDFADPYVQKLQKFIAHVKSSREMEERFMILEEMLEDERNAGREEGRAEGMRYTLLEILNSYDDVPPALREKITNETDPEVLKEWFQAVLRAGSGRALDKVFPQK